jgi:hypothetical protein
MDKVALVEEALHLVFDCAVDMGVRLAARRSPEEAEAQSAEGNSARSGIVRSRVSHRLRLTPSDAVLLNVGVAIGQ